MNEGSEERPGDEAPPSAQADGTGPPASTQAGVTEGPPAQGPPAQGPPAAADAVFQPFLYLHVLAVATISGFSMLAWMAGFYAAERLLWENDFVTSHRWVFPVICLPFALLVGVLVKYLRAPTAMSESLTDSLAGDTSKVEWRRLPVSAAQALASLFSGAALGPEAGLGLLSSQIAAWYGHVLRIPAARRPKLIYASVASAYNGLLENPLFAGVLGSEVAQTRGGSYASLPANLIGGAVGYAVFLLVGSSGLCGLLGLAPVEHIRPLDVLLIVAMTLVGMLLAGITAVFFKLAAGLFARFGSPVVRALLAGVVFSIAGVIAPIVMFSGQTQAQEVVDDPARYGIGLLLLMALAKLALLAVGFRSGFLGGAIFPSIFALTCVAVSLDLLLPGAEQTVLMAGLMVGYLLTLFRTPFMVILLTGFMLEVNTDMIALIVLCAAIAMILGPLLRRLVASRRKTADTA